MGNKLPGWGKGEGKGGKSEDAPSPRVGDTHVLAAGKRGSAPGGF